jgi:hypothetical protein
MAHRVRAFSKTEAPVLAVSDPLSSCAADDCACASMSSCDACAHQWSEHRGGMAFVGRQEAEVVQWGEGPEEWDYYPATDIRVPVLYCATTGCECSREVV